MMIIYGIGLAATISLLMSWLSPLERTVVLFLTILLITGSIYQLLKLNSKTRQIKLVALVLLLPVF
jgi:hypothetical protein